MGQRIAVAKIDQLAPNQQRAVRVQGQEFALFNVEGTIYALTNKCSHSRGPLAEGRLTGTTITCPWHGAKFDVATGKCLAEPATIDVDAYPVHIQDGKIFIELP